MDLRENAGGNLISGISFNYDLKVVVKIIQDGCTNKLEVGIECLK